VSLLDDRVGAWIGHVALKAKARFGQLSS
jgi:hypothetical protein